MRQVAMLSLLIGFLMQAGCVSTPHDNFEKSWIDLGSEPEFKETVEAKSPMHSLWGYMGSDTIHHYFIREPSRLFIGRYKYYRIERVNFDGIPKSEEKPLKRNSGIYSFAFSQANSDGGFNHSFERGLVDEVLLAQPESSKRQNRVAQGNLTPKLPHHRSYGSVSGDSEE